MMQDEVVIETVLYHRPHRHLLDVESNLSPSSTNGAKFDTNMVIILATLLFALVCVLGLNSILRCVWRCGRRSGLDASNETVARLAESTCGKKNALGRIPVVVYRPGMNMKATDCLICLGEFMDGEKVRVLPKCNHGFHVRCIDTWLMSGSSCPTCRRSLLDQTMSSDAAEVTEDGIRQHEVG